MAQSSAPKPLEPIWVIPKPNQRLHPIERWFVVVLRVIAFILLLRALFGWLMITGFVIHPELGDALLGSPYVRFALFATLTCASLLAALGMWLLATWGAMLWLVVVVGDALLFFVLPNLGLTSVTTVLVNAGLVSVYLGMLLQVRRLRRGSEQSATPETT